ncbi:autotransporter outer membrane beta-barrel domain-containing protein [Rhizobium ruizarguesonis]
MIFRLTAMLALTSCPASIAFDAQALEAYSINDAAGNPFMQLRIFGVNDGAYSSNGEAETTSTWNLQQPQADRILGAVRYWGEVVRVAPGHNPAIINVGTYDYHGASAFSPTSIAGITLVDAAITNSKMDDLISGAHGFISVGENDWAPGPFTPSQLPLTPKLDMTSALIHELAHTLGVGASTITTSDDGKLLFPSTLDAWSSHLRDEDGNAAAAGEYLCGKACLGPSADVDVFNARNDQAYFAGKNVNAVLAQAMPGIRVRTGTDFGYGYDMPVFSHLELKNSLMSHQNYRNYTNLMEAELATLQDIGYTIDRRNFFGYSVYNNGLTLINDHPFFARNAAGTGYTADTFNMATLGLGLHIYGGNNTTYQRADLLSGGAGGGGIRVDGAGNNLTILPGTRVYADGANGRAVMFAYGKDHTFTQRGDVEALGERGIAISFDFGHNSLGDTSEYRGSYFVDLEKGIQNDVPDYYANALEEVSGPLVKTFDLSGRVAGRDAAIYMSENGFAGQINVMQGAGITGDIISNYAQKDDEGHLRITDLNFGLKSDREGHSTRIADRDFRITYDGNIIGNNLSLRIDGGSTQFTGNHRLYDVTVAPSATLSGKGSYLVDAERQFHNDGIVNPSVPGAATTIDGDYIQSESGALQLAFNDRKEISSLIVNGNADLSGSVAFAPIKGGYQNGFSITSDKFLTASTVDGAFDKITSPLVSPTLTAKTISNGNNRYTVSLTRPANTYAQYGKSGNSRNVGGALYGEADKAELAPHNLITALDFSAADGSAVRAALPQLSPEPYASAAGVLVNASGITRSAVNNRLQQAFGGIPVASVLEMGLAPTPHAVSKDDLTRCAAWGSVFGSRSSQSGDGNVALTKSTVDGFITGIDTAVFDNWRLGVMAGYSRLTFNTAERHSSGSSDNYTIGTYTGTEWAASGGAIDLRTGLSYAWHNVEMNRSIAFAGFNDNLSADYDAETFHAFGELGYKLNIAPGSILESYANLAYVHVRTDAFSEKSPNGAALSVHADSMDTTLSTLGLRASTGFDLDGRAAAARVDLGWRHAYGDVIPASTASFAIGSTSFTSTGNVIGRDTALVEAGFDLQLNKNTTLGLAYEGQFGSGVTQNGVKANLRVAF